MNYKEMCELIRDDVVVEKMMMPTAYYPGYHLSDEQARVLFFFLKGFSRSGVTEMTGLHGREINRCLRELIIAFGVRNYNEVISVCYRKGFYNLILVQALIQ
ncbi:Uncharacterised protein [Cedecea neteri]|uniref:Uncharacterized protein n=1 Tax=Cedecea neteri TaxID=158822 RepID=A0A291E5V3_9ENTR|nr:hypothetical protein [Cedecea neteri]ATF95440.1 hypothetical protein CO704_25525 [Cedecea neteri]SQC92139.1 Uncharacterised protein [Cedecea neteri]